MRYFFYFLLLGITTPLFAQSSAPTWRDLMFDPSVPVPEVQAAFRAEFPAEEYERGVGFKQFKRWEYYHTLRADAQGNRQQAAQVLAEMEKYHRTHPTTERTQTGNWTEHGPIGFPANGTGQPNGNGRLNCVAFHPTNANTLYAGAPSGGFWLTQDGGNTWQKRSGGLTRLGVSSIVVHPTNDQLIYLGTGDRDGGDAPGYGVWRTTNGGTTWSPRNSGMGNRTVYEISMHPTNSNELVALTNGWAWRTTDGGANWSSVYIGNNAKDLLRHPTNPSILYTAGTQVHRSTDAGQTWTRIDGANGLTPSGHNRIALAASADAPNTVYALAGGGSGFVGLYRSTDNGINWVRMSNSPNLLGYSATGNDSESQSWYDLALAADPADADVLYAGGVNIWKSTDGGATWSISGHWVGSSGAAEIHADQHALEFSPHNGHLYVGNDGGFYRTTDNGTTWTALNDGLAVAQIYKIGVAQTAQNLVINGYQDNGTAIMQPSGNFTTEIGGDGMECIIDPADADYMYGAIYYGHVRRSINGGNTFHQIAASGVNGIDQSGGWVTPYLLSPHDASTMVIGYRDVWRSTNVKAGSPSWTNLTNQNYGNLTDLALSPSDPDVFYFSQGSNLYKSTNFSSASPSIQNLTGSLLSGSTVKDIEFHPTDASTVWIAQGNNVYQTTNGGTTWTDVSGTLPNISLNTIVCDKNSTVGAMYVGMDVGVYYRDNSLSDWILFATGLPNAEVTELEIHYGTGECPTGTTRLYAATYGAGLWGGDLYVPSNAAPVACFSAGAADLCHGTTLTLNDQSAYAPSSWQWTISPNTYSFAAGSSATSQNPEVLFTATDTYTVQLTATNANGSTQKSATLPVTIQPAVNYPVATGFETALVNWSIENPDGSTTWTTTTAAAQAGNTSLWVDNYSYSASGNLDHLVSEPIDLSGVTLAQLEFDYAYAHYGASNADGMRVAASSDCGATWTTLFDKTGADLNTIGGPQTYVFTPSAASDWRHEILDLSAYDGQTVQLRFTNVNDYGNNLYLDNVATSSSAALPIVLGDFRGHYDATQRANVLQWNMLDQEPGLTFELQRMGERPTDWHPIAERTANATFAYTQPDRDYASGTNFYRLVLLQYGERHLVSDLISIENAPAGSELVVSPNPSTGVFHLDITHERATEVPVQLFDALGRTLWTDRYVVGRGANRHVLNLGNLPNGTYLLRYGTVVRRLEIVR